MEEKKEKSHSGKKKYESQLTSHMKSKTVESKENKNTNLKRYMHSSLHSSIIYNSQDMEATQASMNRKVGKDVAYTCDETSLCHKKRVKFCHFQ